LSRWNLFGLAWNAQLENHMTVHTLIRTQTIAAPLDQVFHFFADAGNLQQLTPPWLHFEILTPLPISMHSGTIIQYALRIRGIPVYWTTAIPEWVPSVRFVDVQLSGPYRLWHHTHEFQSCAEGTRMTDVVHYKLRYGLIGLLLHRFWVRRELDRIFDFRHHAIARRFSASL
jgi:ligand-binding SRPBCC domain-containing protein